MPWAEHEAPSTGEFEKTSLGLRPGQSTSQRAPSKPSAHAAQSSSPSEGRPSWPHAAAEEKEEQDSQPPLLPSSKLQNSLFEQPQDDGPRHSAASTTPASASAAMIAFWVPRPSALMEALPTCSDAANPPRYGPITSGDFMRGWYAGEYTSMRTLTPAQVQAAEADPGGLLR